MASNFKSVNSILTQFSESELDRHLKNRFIQLCQETDSLEENELHQLSLLLFIFRLLGKKKVIQKLKNKNLIEADLEKIKSAKQFNEPSKIDTSKSNNSVLFDVQLRLITDHAILDMLDSLNEKNKYHFVLNIWSLLNSHQFIDESLNDQFKLERDQLMTKLEKERDKLTDELKSASAKKNQVVELRPCSEPHQKVT